MKSLEKTSVECWGVYFAEVQDGCLFHLDHPENKTDNPINYIEKILINVLYIKSSTKPKQFHIFHFHRCLR